MTRELRVHPVWRTAIWVLLAVMVLAQASALMHRVLHVHAPNVVGAAHGTLAQGEHALPAPSASMATPVQSKLGELWGEHTQQSDCQLFDQLATVAPALTLSALGVAIAPCGLGMGVVPSPSSVFERFYSAQAPPVLL